MAKKKEATDDLVFAPALSSEQKLALRDLQLKVLAARVRVYEGTNQLQKELADADAAFTNAINAIATGLKVDPAVVMFNVDTLEFKLKQ